MIKIDKVKNFNLDETVTCGQIFRFEKELDSSYTIILLDRVINIKSENDTLIVRSNNENDLVNIVKKYFDLERDYTLINKEIIERDSSLKEIVDACNGLKIINSYPFETIISYIISANNSVSSIKKSVDKISELYGEKVLFDDKEYYLFPTAEQLKDVKTEDFRKCSVGFRDKYIEAMVSVINKDSEYLDKFNKMETLQSFEMLQKEKGIGQKVASCILLFAYQKFDVFPIDTWVKKVMKDKYQIEGEKNIRIQAEAVYGKYSGLAIQYMFHYGRNLK